MFTVTTYKCSDNIYSGPELPFDFHCIYILENGKEAYIGESKDSSRRWSEHNSQSCKNLYKQYKFTRMHVITGQLSEETPAKHYENLLIKLMKIDGKFIIVNRDDGEKQHYYRKNEFELYFDKLWLQLVDKHLVNTQEFITIINAASYKYSPHTVLTEAQQNTLAAILRVIDSGETIPHRSDFKNRPILITGDAGTGKTLVAASLFYHLRNSARHKNKKIGLVYTNPATRSEMQIVFKNTHGLHKKDVISPVDVSKNYYDIIICDEAHRLRRGKNLGHYYKRFKQINERFNLDKNHDELDWILANSGCQIFFYDEKQIVSASDIPYESFQQRLLHRKRGIRPVALEDQMRIAAGDHYVPYIYGLLYQRTKEPLTFANYDFRLYDSFPAMVAQIKQKEQSGGLSRLCSSYAWKWKGRETEGESDILIEGTGIRWNSQTAGWLSNENAKEEMGSLYTLAGLDLNYAGVVIGPDLYFDRIDNTIKVRREAFFDHKVKTGATDEELRKYILNTYAVLLTRGIKGTFVYVCDKDLHEYLKKFIPSAGLQ